MLQISMSSMVGLKLLQHRPSVAAGDEQNKGGDQLLFLANGAGPSSDAELRARGKVTEALFSVNTTDPTAMKVRLMERLGEQFGLKMEDFASQSSYGLAIRSFVDKLKLEAPEKIKVIEKELGLDELGISLDNLVDAIIDPTGHASDALDAALRKDLGVDQDPPVALKPFKQDEIGRYGF